MPAPARLRVHAVRSGDRSASVSTSTSIKGTKAPTARTTPSPPSSKGGRGPQHPPGQSQRQRRKAGQILDDTERDQQARRFGRQLQGACRPWHALSLHRPQRRSVTVHQGRPRRREQAVEGQDQDQTNHQSDEVESHFLRLRTTRAGIPTANAPAGTSRVTTDPAPVAAPSPVSTRAPSRLALPRKTAWPTTVRFFLPSRLKLQVIVPAPMFVSPPIPRPAARPHA